MMLNNEDRISVDNSWREAAREHPEMASLAAANTYDHERPCTRCDPAEQHQPAA